MIKWTAIVFFVSANYLFAQDTTQLVKYYDGTKTFWLVTKTDTTLYSTYSNGKKETERKFKNNAITGLYKRWYPTGKLMWEKELVNGKSNGKTVFYDARGIKVAELDYKNDTITDTVYIKENTHLVLGKITSSSIVYGGMQREDGSSNVSQYSGPWMFCEMYAAKVDSIKKPEMVQHFRTDHNGEFFILAPEGNIGFFPKATDIGKLVPGEFYPPPKAWSSGHDGWNMRSPLEVKKEDVLLFILLHHSSVGYAP